MQALYLTLSWILDVLSPCVLLLLHTDHKKYLGFLFLYSAYNNAILHVFVNILKNSVSKAQARIDNPGGGGGKPRVDTKTFSAAVSDDDKRHLDKDGDELLEVPSLYRCARSKHNVVLLWCTFTLLCVVQLSIVHMQY